MTIDQISVFVENKPGCLADITELLAEADIDLRALSIAETADFGILRAIVSEPLIALEVLKNAGISAALTQVLAVELDDVPGSLAGVIRILADAKVSIEYAYAFISRKSGSAYVVLRVEDIDLAASVFAKHGISTASPQLIYDV
jgi:hypothetical protein